ncbi:MAG: hypothetical protein EWM47_01745 [Anaerolineaceae bacterium]|nr:MAG: hypothetical protein EWM47_01745 [Anaerolineaceae bacterium]
MIRKFMSLILCVALLSGSASSNMIAKVEANEPVPVPVMAEDAVKPESASLESNEPSDKALEAAIKAVKQKIDIPKEYSEFNYSYYGTNSYSGVYWTLNWRKPTEYSYIDVSLDKDNNFISYATYNYSTRYRNIPSYLKNELLDKAEAFIKQIAPDIFSKVEFKSSTYDGIYSNTYTYYFQRKEKDIIFPDNSIYVKVDAASGEIRSASIDWLRDTKIPSGAVKLTKEDAAKLIGENLNMKLTYKTNYYRIYDNGQSDFVKKAFLVYEPELSYISIDANSGEVYLTRSEWVEMDFSRNESDSKAEDSAAGEAPQRLTEEEIAKIRELENLITKDKAIDIVTSNKYLHIDDSLLTYTATLNQSYSSKAKERSFVWNIIFNDNRPVDYNEDEDYYRAYANAIVDATTGKILSFNASIKNNYDRNTGKWLPIEIKYTKEYGQNVLEKFLNSQVKSLFEKTKLVDQRDDYVAYYKDGNTPIYGGYTYQYNRFNEGIEFPYNGIYGSVDGVTGKIYHYNTNWDYDLVFESPKGAMTPKEAFDYYISKDGYNLLYEINVINQYDPNYKSKDRYYDYSEAYKVAYEIRLVYRADINPSYISPFTGEQLDYQGQVFKTSGPYLYEDIANTDGNREILLLADMNIGFEGDNFNPDKFITEGEINQLLEKLGYWSVNSEEANASTKLITREELAFDFIKRLGLEKIAKISGIYTTGYDDEVFINSNYLGAVALAKGLELFPEQSNNLFNPKNNISRREAVHTLFNFIKAEAETYY